MDRNPATPELAPDRCLGPCPRTGGGIAFLNARISYEFGLTEDVVTVGDPDDEQFQEFVLSGEDAELPEYGRGVPDSASGRRRGLDVAIVETPASLGPGDRATIGVRLTNATGGAIRGEVTLLSPWGTWPLLPRPCQWFEVAPGNQDHRSVAVAVADGQTPLNAWVLAETTWFGRAGCTEAHPLIISSGRLSEGPTKLRS